ncbi:MAG: rRNA pseudouridine synthase [Flavobacteriales bacterium]|nr:rRNA pseudouridine synthase [Flavobacteriales bacterium]
MQRREKSTFRKRQNKKKQTDDSLMRLNKYIAHAGICSRREADTFIQAGVVKVNGKVITQMGYKVKLTDEVKFNDAKIKSETLRYLLLNKPKNYSGRMENSPNKKDVFQLIKGACKEEIYPINRMGKNNTGLLFFTNDTELAKKLTNPKKRIKEIYHVSLDKDLKLTDLKKIQAGLIIASKKINIEKISYIENKEKNEIGIEITFGGTKLINQIFEQLKYNVSWIDKVFFAGLSKKDLPRKKCRFLTEDEINLLKRI